MATYMIEKTVKTRKQFLGLIKAYREKGYNLITLANSIAELEDDEQLIVIKIAD